MDLARSGGGSPCDGFSALMKEPPALPPREDTVRREPGQDLSRHPTCRHLDLALPDPRAVRSKCLLFTSHPVCGVLLQLPEQTKGNRNYAPGDTELMAELQQPSWGHEAASQP